jgi:hypothetical protein
MDILRLAKTTALKTGEVLSNKYVVRSVGATAAIISAYNVLKDGPEKGMRNTKVELAKNYMDLFVKSQHSSRYCSLIQNMKNFVRTVTFDSPIIPAFVAAKNVVLSTFFESIGHAIPVALSAGAIGAPILFEKVALLSSLPNAPVIGAGISAVSTGLLLLGGGKILLNDVFGIGKKGL